MVAMPGVNKMENRRSLLRLLAYACVEARQQNLGECEEYLQTAAILLWQKYLNDGLVSADEKISQDIRDLNYRSLHSFSEPSLKKVEDWN
jgi:hypothetical protein